MLPPVTTAQMAPWRGRQCEFEGMDASSCCLNKCNKREEAIYFPHCTVGGINRFLKKLHLQPTVSMLTRAAAWPNGRPKVEEHKSFAKLAHTLTNIVQAKANIWTMPTSEGHSALTWGSSPPST